MYFIVGPASYRSYPHLHAFLPAAPLQRSPALLKCLSCQRGVCLFVLLTRSQKFTSPEAKNCFMKLCDVLYDCRAPVHAFLRKHFAAYVELVHEGTEKLPIGNKDLDGLVQDATPAAIARMYAASGIASHVSELVHEWDWSVFLPLIASVPYLRSKDVMKLGYLGNPADADKAVSTTVSRVRDARNNDFGHLGSRLNSEKLRNTLDDVQMLLLLCGADEGSEAVMLCRKLASERPGVETSVLEKLKRVHSVDAFEVKCVLGWGGSGIVFLVGRA
jgi:hypothetical protein